MSVPRPRTGPEPVPDADARSVLEVRDLTKRYPGCASPAVHGVWLAIGANEVVALVGESGCGKTTLLRLVAGLEVPDGGEVRLLGSAVAGTGAWVPPERRGVGMLFQDFALFPHLRVRDNVAFGLRGLPRSERRRRAETMLDRVGLGGLGDRHPHQLSGGQQQRVALARALAPEPRLLLLDEPFSHLDTPLRAELREEVAEALRRSGVPALLVVHDAEDVFVLADRVHVMRAGRIIQSGSPEAVFRSPADVHVARFFGEVNLLPARPTARGVRTPLGVLPCPPGSKGGVRVLVRPEHVRVSLHPDGGVPAVVRRATPQERRLRLSLSVEDEEGELSVTAIAEAERGLAPGDRVYLSARPGEMQLVPESAPEA